MAETRDHIRALADLYLTGGRASPEAAAPALPHQPIERAAIEFILVGHLPVRAGLWLTQYADDVARDAGATALVRLDTEQVVLEILRGRETAAQASAAATLEEAIEAAGPQVMRWIVRPGVGDGPAALLEAGPDLITILSGADEAAIVAAYRTVKELHDAASRLNHPLPSIELAILGADPLAARRAAESVSDTAELHLGLAVPLRRCVRAMGALGSTLHFRFPSEHATPLSTLVKLLASERPHIEASAAPVLSMPPAAGLAPASTVARAPFEEESSVRMQPPHVERMRSLATPIGNMGFGVPSFAAVPPGFGDQEEFETAVASQTTAPEPMRLRPKLEVQVEPKQVAPRQPARSAPPARALTTWIAGLALLPVRCPDAPEVEIAVDAAGALHVVAWEDRLRALSQVSAWLRKHRELVAMACPEHVLNGTTHIAAHIVTSEPSQVADLYGSDLRLHLLAPVEVEGRAGWYSAALNL